MATIFRRHTKTPLINLELSTTTFLDCEVHDDNSTGPLYSVTTSAHKTTVMRSAATEQLKVADIRWPPKACSRGFRRSKNHDALIQFDRGRWCSAESLLHPATFLSPRKFRFPNFPYYLKWRKAGPVYKCVSQSVLGPIATLQVAHPARLSVFETIEDMNSAVPLPVYRGISTLLLDYLFITSLLLVTDAREWMTLATPFSSLRCKVSKHHRPENVATAVPAPMTDHSPSTNGSECAFPSSPKINDLETSSSPELSVPSTQVLGNVSVPRSSNMWSTLVAPRHSRSRRSLDCSDYLREGRITRPWDSESQFSELETVVESTISPGISPASQSYLDFSDLDDCSHSVHELRPLSNSPTTSRPRRKLPEVPASNITPLQDHPRPLPPPYPISPLNRSDSAVSSFATSPRPLPTPPIAVKAARPLPMPKKSTDLVGIEKDADRLSDWIRVLVPSSLSVDGPISYIPPPPAYSSIKFAPLSRH